MKTAQKIYLFLAILIVIGTFFFTYSELVKKENYVVRYKIPCNPAEMMCFTEICDPEVSTECTGNEEEDTSFYSTMYRVAEKIPVCDDYESEECIVQLSTCGENEEGCYPETCEEAQQADETVECSIIEEDSEKIETEETVEE